MDEVKDAVVEILCSPTRKTKKWLIQKLVQIGVEEEFVEVIARRRGVETLLNFDPKKINAVMSSLISSGRKSSKNTDFKTCLKIGILKHFGLPVNEENITRNPKTLLEHKQELERLGLPVNTTTITRNPKTLLEHKQGLERLGLPVNMTTITSNPKTLLNNKQELERLGLPVNKTTITRNPKTLLKHKQELERLGLPVNTATITRNPKTLLKHKQGLERLGLPVNTTTITNPKKFFKNASHKRAEGLILGFFY